MTTLTIWIIIAISLILLLLIFWYFGSYSYGDLLNNIFYLKNSDYMNIGTDDYGNVFLDDPNHIRQKPLKIFYTESNRVRISLDKNMGNKITKTTPNVRYEAVFTIIFTDKNGVFDEINISTKTATGVIKKDQIDINKFEVPSNSYFFLYFKVNSFTKDNLGKEEKKTMIITPSFFSLVKSHLTMSALREF